MVSLIKNGFLLLAFGLVVASFAFAFTAQEEAAFFARAGESANATQFNGYYMVLVDGVEQAVLKQSGSDYAVVEDANELEQAVGKYSEGVFENELKPAIANIGTSFDALNATVDTCIYGSKRYSAKTRGGIYAQYNIRNDPIHFPAQYSAIKYIDANVGQFEKDWLAAQEAIGVLRNSVSNDDSALEAAANARNGLTPVKNGYPKFYEAYQNATALDEFAYYWQTIEYPCAPTADFNSKMDGVLGLISANRFNSKAALVAQIKTQMAARLEDYTQKKKEESATLVAGDLNEKAQALKNKFSAFGLDLTGLSNEISNVANSVGTAAFENASQTFEQRLTRYESIYVDYNSTKQTVSKTEQFLKADSDKYGSTDDRIGDLNKQLNDVKISLRESENSLKNGNLDAVNFSSLYQNTTKIMASAQNLPPKEGQLDLVTIGGILLLVIVGAGAVWYFKRKQSGGGGGPLMPSFSLPKRESVSLEDIEKMD
jgi:hypothetical protein